MTIPKSWAQVNQRQLVKATIEWDGTLDEAEVLIPTAVKPILIAVDNVPNVAMTLTLEHLIRIDNTNASADIGEGTDGVVTITADDAGALGDTYTVEVVVPEGAEEATDVVVALTDTAIVITLAVDALGDPDNAKNTATLIAAAINDAETGLADFTAEASGDGSGTFATAIEAVKFTGGTTEIWAEVAAADGTALEYDVPVKSKVVFGPIEHFPRWLGGRIAIEAASAPTENDVTIVQVVEG